MRVLLENSHILLMPLLFYKLQYWLHMFVEQMQIFFHKSGSVYIILFVL